MSGFPYNEPVGNKYGAPMGRPDIDDEDAETGHALTLRHVPLSLGYDNGGAYWGWPADLWCAWNPERSIIKFVRAPNRAAAIALFLEARPHDIFKQ